MDPEMALRELRHLRMVILEGSDNPGGDTRMLRMAELFEGLDDWICKGGFLPKAWQPSTEALIQLTKKDPMFCTCLGSEAHTKHSKGCAH